MSTDFLSIRPQDLEGYPLYSLLTNLVQPRPIAFVSSLGADGIPNLAPFSFFMVGGANPASLMISPVLNGDGTEKDSLVNIRETGEFVVNTVHREMAEGMNLASKSLPRHESEWDISGFTGVESEIVKPKRVLESLAQLECTLFDVIEHGVGSMSARYVIGEIVRIHVSPEALTDGKVDPAKLRLISRLGGADYLDTRTNEFFQLARP